MRNLSLIVFTILTCPIYPSMLHGFESVMLIELITPGASTSKYNPFQLDFIKEYGPDQLTPNGERMHYTLGSHIRLLYPNIFTNSTTHREIEVLSSSTPMC